eukprot:5309307-Pyramimonas_sp.AAC.1
MILRAGVELADRCAPWSTVRSVQEWYLAALVWGSERAGGPLVFLQFPCGAGGFLLACENVRKGIEMDRPADVVGYLGLERGVFKWGVDCQGGI